MYHKGRVLLRDYTEGTRLLYASADAGDAALAPYRGQYLDIASINATREAITFPRRWVFADCFSELGDR